MQIVRLAGVPDSYVTVMFSESFAELITKGIVWERAYSVTHDNHTFKVDFDVLDKRVAEIPKILRMITQRVVEDFLRRRSQIRGKVLRW